MAEKVVSLKAAEKKHQGLDKASAISNKAITTSLAPDGIPVVLNDQFSDLLIRIMNKRVEHGVTIATVIPHKNQGISAVTDTSKIKEQVPGTSVSSIRLNIKGAYSTYEGLGNYIKDLRTMPVSIVHLKVQGNNFELGVRVYGN